MVHPAGTVHDGNIYVGLDLAGGRRAGLDDEREQVGRFDALGERNVGGVGVIRVDDPKAQIVRPYPRAGGRHRKAVHIG